MAESESDRATRHTRLEHEAAEQERHRTQTFIAGLEAGVEVAVAIGEVVRHAGDDLSGLPEFVDVVAPKNGQVVRGREIVRYDFCADSGVVQFILFVNRVQVRAKKCGADNFMHTRGNRFMVNFDDYPNGPLELKILMTCADDKVYASPIVNVIVKH